MSQIENGRYYQYLHDLGSKHVEEFNFIKKIYDNYEEQGFNLTNKIKKADETIDIYFNLSNYFYNYFYRSDIIKVYLYYLYYREDQPNSVYYPRILAYDLCPLDNDNEKNSFFSDIEDLKEIKYNPREKDMVNKELPNHHELLKLAIYLYKFKDVSFIDI